MEMFVRQLLIEKKNYGKYYTITARKDYYSRFLPKLNECINNRGIHEDTQEIKPEI